MAERKYNLMEQTAKKSSQSFKRLIFYGLIFLVYFLFSLIWITQWIMNLPNVDFLNYLVEPIPENSFSSYLSLCSFIIMFGGLFAAYFIGKKHFEKWEIGNFIVIALVAFMGNLFGCTLGSGMPFIEWDILKDILGGFSHTFFTY